VSCADGKEEMVKHRCADKRARAHRRSQGMKQASWTGKCLSDGRDGAVERTGRCCWLMAMGDSLTDRLS